MSLLKEISETLSRVSEKVDNLESIMLNKHEDNTDRLITAPEAAKRIGLSIQTLYIKKMNNTIPFEKRGRRLYFSTKKLDDWIREGKTEIYESASHSLPPQKRRGQ